MLIAKARFIETLDKKEYAFIRGHIWKTYGLRLRFVCREKEICFFCIKRNSSKAFRVLGADNILAKVERVSQALYWAKQYSRKGK